MSLVSVTFRKILITWAVISMFNDNVQIPDGLVEPEVMAWLDSKRINGGLLTVGVDQ